MTASGLFLEEDKTITGRKTKFIVPKYGYSTIATVYRVKEDWSIGVH